MHLKTALSVIATLIAIISYIPYLRDIKSGKTKPHAFSWFIWALLAYIAGFAQLSAGGGIGSLVALVKITRSDWVSLLIALAAIPVWIITKRPLLSVVIVSIIDLVGFIPTFRKTYKSPHQETTSTYVLSTVKHCLTVLAQQKYNLTTVLYPASLAVATAAFVFMLLVRKVQVTHKKLGTKGAS
jgi:hypothetical protein